MLKSKLRKCTQGQTDIQHDIKFDSKWRGYISLQFLHTINYTVIIIIYLQNKINNYFWAQMCSLVYIK